MCVMTPEYEELVKTSEELTAVLSEQYRPLLNCRPGCSHCCQHDLSVFPIEAFALKRALIELPRKIRARLRFQAQNSAAAEQAGLPSSCPLLFEHRCSVYPSRPVICRTQGLPLLFQAYDGTWQVDVCPLNFVDADLEEQLNSHYLLPLEQLNVRLVQANLAFCRRIGQPEISGERWTMSEIVLSTE
jgi:uncharacterized protein